MANWIKIIIVDVDGVCYDAKVDCEVSDTELEKDILKKMNLDPSKYCVRSFPRRDDGGLCYDDALAIDKVDLIIKGDQE